MTEGTRAAEEGEDGDEPWDDWLPELQSAFELLRAQEEEAAAEEEEEGEGEDDDSDGWNPAEQEGGDIEEDEDTWNPAEQEGDAAEEATGDADAGGPPEGGAAEAVAEAEEEEEEEDSDDDWAPQTQGAANVEDSEKQMLEKLFKPMPKEETGPTRYETKKEADAAGKMLSELRRPPTVAEAKEEVRALQGTPGFDIDALPPPKYRTMSQEEGIEFVNKGATVNIHVQHGRTPLHKASEIAYPLLIKALCDAGGDPDIRDNYGETPLLLMSHTGPWNEEVPKPRRSEAIQMLLSCGADVHVVNPRGRNALHLACQENDHMAIETLIEGMANLNAQDLAGFTPLMWAAGRNGAETVKMLLDYEADMGIKANRGQTAMTFALTNGNNHIVDILEQHQMLLDREEAKRIKEQGERKDDEMEKVDVMLQLPKADWACRKPPPEEMEPYQGRRVYPQAKPDRRSNVY